MHKAVKIGTWTFPHPTQPEDVNIDLYERPPEDAKPSSVAINYTDDDGLPQTKQVPFHDPIVGASTRCAGCGEPFGQQIKIKHQEWVSPSCDAYRTNIGLLLFCQDTYACNRRAAERTPEAKAVMVQAAVDRFAEDTGGARTQASKICKNPKCLQPFEPMTFNQQYHSSSCKEQAQMDRRAVRPGQTSKDRYRRAKANKATKATAAAT